jgi:hypothetical protein
MSIFEGMDTGIPELEPRDYLFSLKLDFDPDSQLIAIGGALQRNRAAEEAKANEIKAIEEHARHLKGLRGEWAVDSWVDELHSSTYQSAAHSMSAVGMIAPLTETVFHQCLRGIGAHFFPNSQTPRNHVRWNGPGDRWWDCHYVLGVSNPTKDVARGIVQLADAVGLLSRLPADLPLTLAALFGYRNGMFHNGLEWPVEERQKFAQRITNENWPADWFFSATSDNRPWIFYMTDTLIDHCLNTINQSLDATGLFVRDVLIPLRDAAPGDANK